LLVAGTLIHPEGDTTLCKILNIGLKPQRLRVKTPIAQIGQIDLTDPFNRAMLCVYLPDNLQDENNVKVHSLPSHEERVRILESKGITFDNPNLTLDQFSELTALLFEYQDLFCSDYEQLPTSRLSPYRIELTNNRPVRQKRYPLSPQQERLLEQYTDKLLKTKIVEPSTSPWTSPALLIRKANYDASRSDDLSMYRMIVDFRKANLQVAGSYQPLVDSQSIFNQ
jgi:hypothetical protein